MMKSIVMSVIVFLTLLVSCVTAAEYTVGVEDIDYTPLYSNQGRTYSGFARDVLDAFAEKQGIVFVYKPLPIKRLFKSLINESIDFKFPDNPSWQIDMKKDKGVIYSQSVVQTIEGLMVLPENRNKGIDHLKTIGTVMGFTPWQYMQLADSGKIRLVENTSFTGLLKQVIAQRIDGAYINTVVANYHLEKDLKQPGALVFDDSLPYGENDYSLSTLKHPDLIKQFDTFLMDHKALVDSLKVKHGIRN